MLSMGQDHGTKTILVRGKNREADIKDGLLSNSDFFKIFIPTTYTGIKADSLYVSFKTFSLCLRAACDILHNINLSKRFVFFYIVIIIIK